MKNNGLRSVGAAITPDEEAGGGVAFVFIGLTPYAIDDAPLELPGSPKAESERSGVP